MGTCVDGGGGCDDEDDGARFLLPMCEMKSLEAFKEL